MNEPSLSLVSHADYENYDYDIKRIVGVRLETLAIAEIPNPLFVGTVPENVDDLPPMTVIVIERSLVGSANLITHFYSPTRQVFKYLSESVTPVLCEDAHLVKFATSFSDDNSAHARSSVHKLIRPLKAENEVFRTTLGLPLSGTAPSQETIRAAAAKISGNHQKPGGKPVAFTTPGTRPSTVPNNVGRPPTTTTESPSAPQSTQPGEATAESPLKPPPRAQTAMLLPPTETSAARRVGGKKTPSGKGSSRCASASDEEHHPHSPLAWEMETNSAINARTPYKAYGPQRHQEYGKLDNITQGQLCARLHDKCMEDRKRRKAEVEEQFFREQGLLEKKTLTSDEQVELATRLHDQQHKHTEKVMNGLRDKFLRPLSPQKKLSSDEQKASACRMHDETVNKAKKNMEKLYVNLGIEGKPPGPRLAKDQQQAMADRLSQRKRN